MNQEVKYSKPLSYCHINVINTNIDAFSSLIVSKIAWEMRKTTNGEMMNDEKQTKMFKRVLSMALLLALAMNSITAAAAERFAYEEITLKELEKGYAEGTFKTEEVVKAYLDRIGIYESNYNAFTMMNAGALQEATEVDRRRAAGEKLGPLQVCRLSSRKPSTSPASRPPSAGPRSAKSSAESS